MTSSLRLAFVALVGVTTFTATALAAANVDPGYVDFGKFTAPAHGEFVQVNIGKGLLGFASLFARHKDAAAADLMSNITRVRVNVVGLDDGNRAATTERMTEVRARLARENWEQIVAVHGKHEEDVAIFLKQRDGDAIDGIVVTVLDERKKEAVFVNIIGNIRADQISAVGERLNLRQLADTK
jgi:hypothetical protein